MRQRPWIDRQLRARGISDLRVLAAMERVPRDLFVGGSLLGRAYDDAALPIGYDQTISQPFIVAWTAQALALRGDERVLDVGSGSGYAAAVLAELAAEVVSIERIPALVELARGNLARAGYADRVELHTGDGALGIPERAPFDAIAVAAATPELPPGLWQQVRAGGRIALPLGEKLCVLERTADGPCTLVSVPARFVPLVRGEADPDR